MYFLFFNLYHTQFLFNTNNIQFSHLCQLLSIVFDIALNFILNSFDSSSIPKQFNGQKQHVARAKAECLIN